MGLLTSPESGEAGARLLAALGRWATPLCFLLYAAGLAAAAALLHPQFNDRTYFSESALLPNLADNDFNRQHDFATFLTQLPKLGSKTEVNNWIVDKFASLSVEAFRQNFTVDIPFSKSVSGENVYGIVRAGREASTESLVLVTDASPEGVALLLSIAAFAREQIYWAKDVILVVAAEESVGVGAWLSAYHSRPVNRLRRSELEGRGGQIQAALALSLQSAGPFSHVDIRFHMTNGQLPNLDIVNLLVKIVRDEALTPTIYDVIEDPFAGPYSQGYYPDFVKTAFKGMVRQASCRGDGLHGLFGSYGIEAATIHPYLHSTREHQAGAFEIGRILEGALRSLNNLLERFHQSFFFYLRPSPHRYISIGLYMIPLGLLLLAPVLKAACLWAGMNETSDKKGEVAEDTSILGVIPYLVISHMLGLICLFMPKLIHWFDSGSGGSVSGGSVLLHGVTGVFLVAASVPLSLGGRRSGEWRASPTMLRCVTLLQLALVLGTLALLNFSLGAALACVYVPVMLLAAPTTGRVPRAAVRLVVLAANPLVLFLAQSAVFAGADWDGGRAELHRFLVDYAVFQSWLLPFASIGLVPLWTQAWILAND